VVMWVVGSVIFLVPAIAVTIRLLQREQRPRCRDLLWRADRWRFV